MNRKPQTLYRMYNADDQLLYVGITARVCEFAQGDPSAPNTGHFNEHYYLGDAAGNYRMDIDVLPVASKNWRSGNADKGGFIQQATGWQPTPLLPTVSLSMLRRRMWARRA